MWSMLTARVASFFTTTFELFLHENIFFAQTWFGSVESVHLDLSPQLNVCICIFINLFHNLTVWMYLATGLPKLQDYCYNKAINPLTDSQLARGLSPPFRIT